MILGRLVKQGVQSLLLNNLISHDGLLFRHVQDILFVRQHLLFALGQFSLLACLFQNLEFSNRLEVVLALLADLVVKPFVLLQNL